MWYPKFSITVTDIKSEKKTYRDRVSGASRDYETFTISGINLEESTMAILNVVDEIRNDVRAMAIEKGNVVECQLRQFEYDKGLLRGTVVQVEK